MSNSIPAAVRGNGRKVVVLLHGFGGCCDLWGDVVDRLDGAYTTIAYDLPGHGRSLDFPKGGPAKVAASAILADLAARGIDNAHFVGHSMGGAVATLAAVAPDHIRSCLAQMSSPDSKVSETAVSHLAEMRRRLGQTEKLVAFAEAMTAGDRQGTIPREMIAALAMPVMVVWGTDDSVLPYSHADGLPDGFLIHHVLEVGHMLPEETPDLVADIIQRMTRRRSRPERAPGTREALG